MGDIADMLIDQMWDDLDRDDWDDEPPAQYWKKCRCCGQEGLHWNQIDGKWRLCNDDGLHMCPVNPLVNRVKS